MKKTIPAFFAALTITLMLGAGMFLIGQNAMETSAAAATVVDTSAMSEEMASQFQQVLVEYQTRETQYQNQLNVAIAEINAANEQIAVSNQQIQEYKNLLAQLQSNGVISIAPDGTVNVTQQTSFASHPPRGKHGDH